MHTQPPMQSIDSFIQQHSIETTANTTYRDGFPIYVKVITSCKNVMSQTEYDLLFQKMTNRNDFSPPIYSNTIPEDVQKDETVQMPNDEHSEEPNLQKKQTGTGTRTQTRNHKKHIKHGSKTKKQTQIKFKK